MALGAVVSWVLELSVLLWHHVFPHEVEPGAAQVLEIDAGEPQESPMGTSSFASTPPMVSLCLIAAALLLACGNDLSLTATPTATPEPQPTSTSTPQEIPIAGSIGVDEPSPTRGGSILVFRDGDLHLLEGRSERQLTDSGNYWTGVLTRDGDIIALQRADDVGSSLVRLEVGESTVTKTDVAALN